MRRVNGWLMWAALVTMLLGGCGGSTARDRLVLKVVGFNGTGITQQDSVGASSADVDVVQDCCSLLAGCEGTVAECCQTFENVTQTKINVVLRNEEAADIRLERYTTQISDRRIEQVGVDLATNAVITGGRCDTPADRQCAVDADCVQGATIGTCSHTDTRVSDLLLFDIFAKQIVHDHPEVQNQGLTVTFTFFGSDPLQSFQATANYVVTFADFDNCSTSTTGGTGAS